MKKTLFIFILVAVLILSLVACDKEHSMSSDDDFVVNTETEAREKGKIVDTEVINNKKLNMVAVSVSTTDEYVVEGQVRKQNDGIKIEAYSDGAATLTVYDWWGNTSTVDVLVENKKIISADVTPIKGNVANVTFFGAVPNDQKDDSTSIQKAVDSLKKTGGIVYFPAGRYLSTRIILHDGVHIKLQGRVDDVKNGYTESVKQQVLSEFAIIDTQLGGAFYNFDTNGKGNNGASNISISGGMIDLGGRLASGQKAQVDINLEGVGSKKATQTGGLIFSCAENILIDNVIFKDAYNGHVFQIGGVSNMTIKNCMFAGYMCRVGTAGDLSTLSTSRETIQIEYCHKDAFGAPTSDPCRHFERGEFYYCSNIKVTGCYFGDSDTSGYHMTAIGQHGQNGKANVTGLEISNNVFDNPYISGIKCPNYCDVTISGNTFISNVKGYKDGSLVDLYTEMSDKTYWGLKPDGTYTHIISAPAQSHDGLHNIKISDNTFKISGTSNKRAISIIGTDYTNGAITVTNKLIQAVGKLSGDYYTGFIKSTNTATNISLKENIFEVSTSEYTDYIVYLDKIIGLETVNNTVNTSGFIFSQSYDGQKGFKVQNSVSPADSNTLTLSTDLTDKFILLPDGKGGTIKISANSSCGNKLILKGMDGIALSVTIDTNGNAVINAVCDNGKVFDGWNTPSGELFDTVVLSSDLVLIAKMK